MKFTRMLMFSLMILTANFLAQSVSFNDYFSDQTMRVDYFHIGDATTEVVTVDHIYQYGIWAGSTKNLLDNFNNGAYYYKIYDAASGKLIFSRGFDSYFKEYQVSGFKDLRTYHESAIIPFPKNKIKFALDKRDSENKLKEIFSTEIDPADIGIIKDLVKDDEVKVYKPVYKEKNKSNDWCCRHFSLPDVIKSCS